MTTPARNPPFRAEHIGSLLRPEELVEKRYAVADGSASAESLVPIEQKAIREVVDLQQQCGIHSITNGEYSRHMFWGTFFETLNGMEEINLRESGYDNSIFRAYAPDVKSFMHDKTIPNSVTVATGKISHTGKSSFLPELEYLKSILPRDKWKDIKLTLTSPSWYHFRYGPGKAYVKGVYANDEEYFADVAQAYRTELNILYDAGLRNAQVDDPNLAYFCSDAMLAGWRDDKQNFQTAEQQLHAYLRFYNRCFQRPADLHLGVHLCRGNYIGSRSFSAGAYDAIAETLFARLDVATFYLEYDTPRAGGFEPLRHLPRDKSVVLGVVTSKFPELETQADMVERIHKAADFVAAGSGQSREEALDRLSVSPQVCLVPSAVEVSMADVSCSVASHRMRRATRSGTRTCARSCCWSGASPMRSGPASREDSTWVSAVCGKWRSVSLCLCFYARCFTALRLYSDGAFGGPFPLRKATAKAAPLKTGQTVSTPRLQWASTATQVSCIRSPQISKDARRRLGSLTRLWRIAFLTFRRLTWKLRMERGHKVCERRDCEFESARGYPFER